MLKVYADYSTTLHAGADSMRNSGPTQTTVLHYMQELIAGEIVVLFLWQSLKNWVSNVHCVTKT